MALKLSIDSLLAAGSAGLWMLPARLADLAQVIHVLHPCTIKSLRLQLLLLRILWSFLVLTSLKMILNVFMIFKILEFLIFPIIFRRRFSTLIRELILASHYGWILHLLELISALELAVSSHVHLIRLLLWHRVLWCRRHPLGPSSITSGAC